MDEILPQVLETPIGRDTYLKTAILAAQGDEATVLPLLNQLGVLVRQWMQQRHYDVDFFDTEMIRRRTDPTEIFFIKPSLETYFIKAIENLSNQGIINPSPFARAEAVRDQLEADGYPREICK